MKNLIIILISLFSAASFAAVTSIYQEEVEFPIYVYQTQEECEADEGTWQTDYLNDAAMCFFKGANQVKLTIEGDSITEVEMSTITVNGHSCDFTSEKVVEEGKKITASTASEMWDWQTDEFKPVTCEVYITKNDDGTVSADANGKCREFCGMRGFLYLDNAVKVK